MGTRHLLVSQALGLDDAEFDEFAAHHGITFAPREAATRRFAPKNNFFGIGYKGMSATVRFKIAHTHATTSCPCLISKAHPSIHPSIHPSNQLCRTFNLTRLRERWAAALALVPSKMTMTTTSTPQMTGANTTGV